MSLNGHTPPTGRRRRGRPVNSDSAETRNRILHAARHVINERGYQAATFQAIAVTADLSRPTLHYYFANREEIFRVLLDDASAVIVDCISAAERYDTLVDRLSALLFALQAADDRDRSTVAFLVSARLEASRNPTLRFDPEPSIAAYLTTIVDEAVERGELPGHISPKSVVDMLHALLWGIGFYSGFLKDSTSMLEITRQLAKTLSHGVLGSLPVR